MEISVFCKNAGNIAASLMQDRRGRSIKAALVSLASLLIAPTALRAQPVFISQQPNWVVWAGANVTFGAATSSSRPFAFHWLFNFTNLPSRINITTVAGNGQTNYSGDGGAATNAGLNYPNNVAVDGLGNFFIADRNNSRIRKVGTNGIITTVAGNGTNGYSGDGGPATNAELSFPASIALDASGNLFVADSDNFVIRKVDINGIITTVAGNGTIGYSGDGGPATNASLYYPYGVAVDANGNLYFSENGLEDELYGFIRKVDTNGIITTVAGSPTNSYGYTGDGGAATNANLTAPRGIAVDSFGNLFIADFDNNRIRKVDTNGIITTVAGNGGFSFAGDGGAATNASLRPFDVVADNSGNLFIADSGNGRIREVGTNGIITTVAGNGGTTYSGDNGLATNASLNFPTGIAVDTGSNLFIADSYNQRIRMVTGPQWPNSQSSSLSLSNVTILNAGKYQEVITDPYGSATSNIGSLIVVTSPLIYQTIHNPNGSLALNFVCQPASTNVVLSATSLSPPVVWTPVSTNLAGTDGDWQFTDTNAAAYPAKFYRSLTQ